MVATLNGCAMAPMQDYVIFSVLTTKPSFVVKCSLTSKRSWWSKCKHTTSATSFMFLVVYLFVRCACAAVQENGKLRNHVIGVCDWPVRARERGYTQESVSYARESETYARESVPYARELRWAATKSWVVDLFDSNKIILARKLIEMRQGYFTVNQTMSFLWMQAMFFACCITQAFSIRSKW